jgi:hypothetical protein
VRVPNKDKLTARNFPANMIQNNPKLKARLAVKDKLEADIRRFNEANFEKGDHVRARENGHYFQPATSTRKCRPD